MRPACPGRCRSASTHPLLKVDEPHRLCGDQVVGGAGSHILPDALACGDIELEQIMTVNYAVGVVKDDVSSGAADASMTHVLWIHIQLQALELLTQGLVNHAHTDVDGVLQDDDRRLHVSMETAPGAVQGSKPSMLESPLAICPAVLLAGQTANVQLDTLANGAMPSVCIAVLRSL